MDGSRRSTGRLKDLYVSPAHGRQLAAEAQTMPSWTLLPRQLSDVELLLNGALSPLDGFMDERTYHGVLRRMRLPDDSFWPLPISLDVSESFAGSLARGVHIALRDAEGVLVAVLELGDLFIADPVAEASALFGTTHPDHPAVAQLRDRTHPVRAGGRLLGIARPTRYAFMRLRATPAQLHDELSTHGATTVVGFHTRGFLHRPHRDLLTEIAQRHDALLLLHPALDGERSDQFEESARVRSYERALAHFPRSTLLRLVDTPARFGGAREAALNALLRRNFGCSHFVIAPREYLAETDAAALARFSDDLDAMRHEHADAIGIEWLHLDGAAVGSGPRRTVAPLLSDSELRRQLSEGREPPESTLFPEVLEEARRVYPPRDRQGFTVFLTGLSGAGKSTVAQALALRLSERDHRRVTLLDGDLVRTRLSSELGFSREHRDLNVLRIGYVASEITRHGGIAICAPIAPYAATRRQVREMIESLGGFIEVHVSTPLTVCEQRDRKGLYAKARAGLLKGMTGVDDPYERPEKPELRLDTSELFTAQAVDFIVSRLRFMGYLPQSDPDGPGPAAPFPPAAPEVWRHRPGALS